MENEYLQKKYFWFYSFPRVDSINVDLSCIDLSFIEENGAITNILFGMGEAGKMYVEETPLIKRVVEQMGEYLVGSRKSFDFPILPSGTMFQKKVWDALVAIPYGETRSYKEVAVQAGNSKAARAVGMANNRNPIPIVIPCHRVIGYDGSLTGFGGGLDLKRYLLELEKVNGIGDGALYK